MRKPLSLFSYWYALTARELGVVTNSSGAPAGAISKRQMFRRYTGNALQAALGQSNPVDARRRALRQTTRAALVQWIADYVPELQPTVADAIGKMPAYPFAHPDDWAGSFAAGC